MGNPLFNQYGNMPSPVGGPVGGLMAQLQQFRNMLQGNPQEIVQNLIQSGQMSQDQFNRYSQMANQILGMK